MSLQPPIHYIKSEYIETDTGNKVSRRAVIAGPQNIILGGKTIIASGAIIRGDLRRTGAGHAVVISLGRYCLVGEGSIIRPPYKTYRGNFNYYPMKIGDYVHIGANSVVEAATIGSHVEIGKNCIIGKFTIIKDCAKIADNTVLMPNSVVPALAHFAGAPGEFIEDLPESTQEIVEAETKSYYNRFQPLEFAAPMVAGGQTSGVVGYEEPITATDPPQTRARLARMSMPPMERTSS